MRFYGIDTDRQKREYQSLLDGTNSRMDLFRQQY